MSGSTCSNSQWRAHANSGRWVRVSLCFPGLAPPSQHPSSFHPRLWCRILRLGQGDLGYPAQRTLSVRWFRMAWRKRHRYLDRGRGQRLQRCGSVRSHCWVHRCCSGGAQQLRKKASNWAENALGWRHLITTPRVFNDLHVTENDGGGSYGVKCWGWEKKNEHSERFGMIGDQRRAFKSFETTNRHPKRCCLWSKD